MTHRRTTWIVAVLMLASACGAETTTTDHGGANRTVDASTTTIASDVIVENPSGESVEVLVARTDISAGTSGTEAVRLFEVAVIPEELRPSSAVRPDEVESLVGLVTTEPIATSQIVIWAQFAEPG